MSNKPDQHATGEQGPEPTLTLGQRLTNWEQLLKQLQHNEGEDNDV